MDSKAATFTAFIDWLNHSAIVYFIPWGYEELPFHLSGGDVDLYVHPKQYATVTRELLRRGYAQSQCPASHDHAQFAQAGYHSIDLFSSFCFSFEGKTTLLHIDANHLIQGRTKRGMLWIASPVVELLFTALRVVGGRTDCITRLKKFLEVR